MKKLLMALAVTAFAWSGAEAQTCSLVKKHKKKIVRTTPVKQEATLASQCRMVPYQVCKINADRTTVTCYKTTDLDNLTPLNSELTHYGPVGAVPGPTEKLAPGTVVIPGPAKGDFCRRDEANKATVCTYQGKLLQRDMNGVYGYGRLPHGTITDVLPDNRQTQGSGLTSR